MKYPPNFSRLEKDVFDLLLDVHDTMVIPEKKREFRQTMLTIRSLLHKIDNKGFKKIALKTIQQSFKTLKP